MAAKSTLIVCLTLLVLVNLNIQFGSCTVANLMREIARRRAEELLRYYPDLLNEINLNQNQFGNNRLPVNNFGNQLNGFANNGQYGQNLNNGFVNPNGVINPQPSIATR